MSCNRIKKLREQKGWTQQQLGEMLQPPKHFTVISRWERGKVKPSADNLIALARVLETDPAALFLPGV